MSIEFFITTGDWAIVKYRWPGGRKKKWIGEVCRARPGSTKKEAWDNACDACKVTRREFRAAGWEAQRLVITGKQ